MRFTGKYSTQIERLRQTLAAAQAVVIGAGAGLSTAAGFTYSGKRFEHYFADFIRQYGFSDMYTGGFYPFASPEEHWAYWSRYIWINRYMDAPKPVYRQLLRLVQNTDYFVITTNADHCFQKAGFDKMRLFTHRATTDSGSVPSPAIKKRTPTTRRLDGCLMNKRNVKFLRN